ncbi:uncharacterized protein [Blastocystis hominis]|uniref:U6 snRNA-associated Sm-like protein LSm8 n=1 Tax=Blastocystis hominis TaxID=12968 RepID=D8M9Q4_BLAHO|nr:uncharacterized protein [Blastocystis hominis]CBK24793.2 unnamed protein product [Blastocystis hominis]|eukprot:XP_012898841.1 uncharacterized protein [Blastocystis hominis]
MAEELGKMMNKKVVILTNDGRTFTGMLRGVDQVTNLILEDVEERIFSQTEPMRVEKYDVYLFRGDDTSLIGLYSEEKDGQVNWSEVRADPVGPITHYSCLFKQSILHY